MLPQTLFLAGHRGLRAAASTEPKVRHVARRGSTGSAIRLRPVQIITLALVFVGAMFATAEVSVIAITEELGQPSAASLVIGVYAVGSFVRRAGGRRAEPEHAAAAAAADGGQRARVTALPLLVVGSRCRSWRSRCSSAASRSRRPSSPPSA